MSRRIIFSVIDEFVKALVCTGGSPLIPEDENLYGFFAGGWDFEWYDHLEDAEPGHVKGGVDFPVGTGRHGGTGCLFVHRGQRMTIHPGLTLPMLLQSGCIIMIGKCRIFFIRNGDAYQP